MVNLIRVRIELENRREIETIDKYGISLTSEVLFCLFGKNILHHATGYWMI